MDKILTLLATTTPSTALECGAAGLKWEKQANGKYGCTVPTNYKAPQSPENIITDVINWILYIVGIAAVVMIIVGGIRYATSAGNEKAVTGAKNTIIYALIGLAAAMLAWVIVNFFVSNLLSSGTTV